MKTCDVCGYSNDYIMFVNHRHYTVKEWKKFDRYAERINGIERTFQEILLDKYEIILIDYKTKKEKVIDGLKKINMVNFNKGMKTFSQGISAFSSGTGGKKKNTVKIWSDKPKRQENQNTLKIWSDPPVQKRKARKTKSEKWDRDEKNLEKIWGKRR